MKSHLHNTVLFISILCGLILISCAVTNAAQTKTVDITDFYGTWSGTWNRDGYSGGAVLVIGQSSIVDFAAQIEMNIYGPRPEQITIRVAKLSEGELVVYKTPLTPNAEALPGDPRNITLRFRFRSDNSLQGFYHRGTQGQYQLSRR